MRNSRNEQRTWGVNCSMSFILYSAPARHLTLIRTSSRKYKSKMIHIKYNEISILQLCSQKHFINTQCSHSDWECMIANERAEGKTAQAIHSLQGKTTRKGRKTNMKESLQSVLTIMMAIHPCVDRWVRIYSSNIVFLCANNAWRTKINAELILN